MRPARLIRQQLAQGGIAAIHDLIGTAEHQHLDFKTASTARSVPMLRSALVPPLDRAKILSHYLELAETALRNGVSVQLELKTWTGQPLDEGELWIAPEGGISVMYLPAGEAELRHCQLG